MGVGELSSQLEKELRRKYKIRPCFVKLKKLPSLPDKKKKKLLPIYGPTQRRGPRYAKKKFVKKSAQAKQEPDPRSSSPRPATERTDESVGDTARGGQKGDHEAAQVCSSRGGEENPLEMIAKDAPTRNALELVSTPIVFPEPLLEQEREGEMGPAETGGQGESSYAEKEFQNILSEGFVDAPLDPSQLFDLATFLGVTEEEQNQAVAAIAAAEPLGNELLMTPPNMDIEGGNEMGGATKDDSENNSNEELRAVDPQEVQDGDPLLRTLLESAPGKGSNAPPQEGGAFENMENVGGRDADERGTEKEGELQTRRGEKEKTPRGENVGGGDAGEKRTEKGLESETRREEREKILRAENVRGGTHEMPIDEILLENIPTTTESAVTNVVGASTIEVGATFTLENGATYR